jgi:hypothetical protein
MLVLILCVLLIRLAERLRQESRGESLPGPGRPGCYEFRVINWGATDKAHCDPNDCGLTMILVVTSQPDHFLALPEINTKVRVGNGTIVALASAYLDHFVSGTRGSSNRYSLLFISQIAVARFFGIGLPDLA